MILLLCIFHHLKIPPLDTLNNQGQQSCWNRLKCSTIKKEDGLQRAVSTSRLAPLIGAILSAVFVWLSTLNLHHRSSVSQIHVCCSRQPGCVGVLFEQVFPFFILKRAPVLTCTVLNYCPCKWKHKTTNDAVLRTCQTNRCWFIKSFWPDAWQKLWQISYLWLQVWLVFV